MKAENAIEIRNMSKSFKIQSDKANSIKELFVLKRNNRVQRHEVLNNINLDIKKGDTVCLIGSNGSGKSTLLKLMTRIIYPNGGDLKTDGKVASLLELGAGFHPDFTGRENIYFNAAVFGMTRKEIEGRIDDIIDFSELHEFIDEPIRTYSSGMYMRLAFSIAINVDADILLIDEILAVGDQHFQDKCYAKLEELRDNENKTIVIVSHSLGVVKKLCRRAIWIYRGSIRLDGDPAYVIEEYLAQMAKDHQEEKRQAVLQGKKVKFKGIIFFDSPKDYSKIRNTNPILTVQGWKLCDCETSVFELYLGKTKFTDFVYRQRQDVMTIYSEEYSGLVNEDEVGWKVEIDLSKYLHEIQDDRTFKLTAVLKRDTGEVIQEETAVLIYEEVKE